MTTIFITPLCSDRFSFKMFINSKHQISVYNCYTNFQSLEQFLEIMKLTSKYPTEFEIKQEIIGSMYCWNYRDREMQLVQFMDGILREAYLHFSKIFTLQYWTHFQNIKLFTFLLYTFPKNSWYQFWKFKYFFMKNKSQMKAIWKNVK